VEHLFGCIGEVSHVLSCHPPPSSQLPPHFHDFHNERCKQGIGGNDVALIGQHDDRASLVLVLFREVVNSHHDGGIGNRQLSVVTLTGECRQIDNGYICIRPRLTVRVENLALESITEQPQGLSHLKGTHAAMLRVSVILMYHDKSF